MLTSKIAQELFKIAKSTQHSYASDSSYNFKHSIFQNLQNRSILIYSDNVNFSANSCYFFNSSSHRRGGAVDLSFSTGSIIHEKICGISCNTYDHGHYTYSNVKFGIEKITQCSFVNSGDKTPGSGILILYAAKQEMKFTNTSESQTNNYGSFAIFGSENKGIVSFMHITNSICYNYDICDFRFVSYDFSFSAVRNCTSKMLVKVYEPNSALYVHDCNFIDDNCSYLLHNNFPQESFITASNCFVMNTPMTSLNAVFESTVENEISIDFDTSHLQCKIIPDFYIKIDRCTVYNNLSMRSFNYLYYIVFLLI